MNNFSDNGTIMAIQEEDYTENIQNSRASHLHIRNVQFSSSFCLSTLVVSLMLQLNERRQIRFRFLLFIFKFSSPKCKNMQRKSQYVNVHSLFFSKIGSLPIYLISKEILLINLYINTMKMPEPNNEEKFCLPSWQSIPGLSKNIGSISSLL